MEGYFRTALSFFDKSSDIRTSSSEVDPSNETNPYIGTFVSFSKCKVVVKKLIAEGGFAYVFLAQDVSSRFLYALKRLIVVDKESLEKAQKEVRFMTALSGSDTIVRLIDVVQIGKKQSSHGNSELLLLMEYCQGGTLVDVMNQYGFSAKFSVSQVAKIFSEVCRALIQLHSHEPPIIHRDLKIENLLVSDSGVVKLCDFGSATTTVMNPKTTREIAMAEDEIQLNTTAQYRAPEMVDFYSHVAVTFKSDIWALGILLYKLCFFVTPFEDGSKNAIANVNFKFPSDEKYQIYHDLIRILLAKNPENRPTALEALDEIQKISQNLTESPAPLILPSSAFDASPQDLSANEHLKKAPAKSLNLVAEKSKSFIRSVVSRNTTKTCDIDLSLILPRILAMSFPSEGVEATFRNDIKNVGDYLQNHYQNHYMVYNLTKRTYNRAHFNNNVVDLGWIENEPPTLEALFLACQSIDQYLRASTQNLVVIHCKNGKAATATLIAAYLSFVGYSNPSDAFQLFCKQRLVSGRISILPSQFRYVSYIHGIVNQNFKFRRNGIILERLSLQVAPSVDVLKTGCRPYVEISKAGKLIFSSAPSNPDKIPSFKSESRNSVDISLGACQVFGDICITVYHAHVLFGKLKSSVMFRFFLCVGCLPGKPGISSTAKFPKTALDLISSRDSSYPQGFFCELGYEISNFDAYRGASLPWTPITNLPNVKDPNTAADVCFVPGSSDYLQYIGSSRNNHHSSNLSKESPRSAENHSSSSSSPFHSKMDSFTSQTPQSICRSKSISETSSATSTSAANLFDWQENTFEPIPAFNQQSAQIPIPPSNLLQDHYENEIQEPLFDVDFEKATKDGEFDCDNFSSTNHTFTTSALDNASSTSFSKDDPFRLFETDMPSIITVTDVDCSQNSSPAPFPTNISSLNADDFFSNDSTAILDTLPLENPLQPTSKYPPAFETSRNDTGYKSMNHLAGKSSSYSNRSPISHNSFAASAGSKGIDPFESLGDFSKPSKKESSANSSERKNGSQKNFIPSSSTSQNSHFTRPNYNLFIPSAHSQPTHQYYPKPGKSPRLSPGNSPGGSPSTPRSPSFDKSNNYYSQPNQTNATSESFADLLGVHNFKPTEPKKTSMNALKMEQLGETEGGTRDAVKFKVEQWENGKKGNIRALLSTMQHILWAGSEWEDISIANLVKPIQVKKAYMKACLLVHPDKVIAGSEHEELARQIFVVLNDAYNSFKENGALPLV